MFPFSQPFFGVNMWDQTLFSGYARVTLTTKTPRHRRQGKVTAETREHIQDFLAGLQCL